MSIKYCKHYNIVVKSSRVCETNDGDIAVDGAAAATVGIFEPETSSAVPWPRDSRSLIYCGVNDRTYPLLRAPAPHTTIQY